MTQTVVDGVVRRPENGVKVVVIGAGVAGLQVALECWRNGCDVEVIERADGMSSVGDYFTITPSALTTLKYYPSMYAEYHRHVYDCTVHVCSPEGVSITAMKPEWKRPGAVHSAPDVDISFLSRRPVWATMQLQQCMRLKLPIFWNEKVVSVEESETTVRILTASGKTFEGDVCVGAHGVASKIPGFEIGPETAVQDSGYAVARVAFPRSDIKEGSLANTLLKDVETAPSFRTYLGDDTHLILFLTKDYVAFCFTHADKDAKESWHNFKSAAELIPYIENSADSWHPAVLDFVRSAPNEIVDWKLRWRDSSPQWTSEGGRLIRAGDAAHAFFPTAGNGAVQGLEDALSLAECLRIGGKQGVPQATKVHNKLRFERVSILQQTGFLNREELHSADLAALTNGTQKDIGFFKIGRWVWGHDPVIYARDNYAMCLASSEGGKPFKNTNVPPGHVYQPWSLESEYKRMQAGIKSNLKQNGDWSC